MRTRRRRGAAAVLAVSALCLTAAACGSGDDTSDKGDKKANEQAKDQEQGQEKGQAEPLTAALMKAGTLEVKDLPAGYEAGKPEPDDETYTADKKECGPIAQLLADKMPGVTTGTSVEFQGDGGNSAVTQQVLTFPGKGAEEFVKSVGTALESCTAFVHGADAEKIEVKVEKLQGPVFGEESHSLRLSLNIAQLSMKFDVNLMVARQGTGVTRFSYVPENASGHKNFDDLAKRAGDKFVKGVQG
ncbi:hypothetical protein ACWF94_10920 [Streptomyces sp. NPDC055078]